MDWLKGFKKLPKKVFVVHGEEESTTAFAQYIKDELKLNTIVPNLYEQFDLDGKVKVSIIDEEVTPDDQQEDLLDDMVELSTLFSQTLTLSKKILALKLPTQDHDSIKNQLIELEKDLLDLNMLLGDKERDA